MLAGLALTVACAEPAAVPTAATPAPAATATPARFSDPFAYCAAVGDIDAPDARFTGVSVPAAIEDGMRRAGGPTNGLRWRCIGGQVYACGVGANLPCGPADTTPQPRPGLVAWCAENPDAATAPAVATGRETVYEWGCRGATPTIVRQVLTADARGFIAQFWRRITPA
jgi:hypothetical protein